jgi:hypothetical protein
MKRSYTQKRSRDPFLDNEFSDIDTDDDSDGEAQASSLLASNLTVDLTVTVESLYTTSTLPGNVPSTLLPSRKRKKALQKSSL